MPREWDGIVSKYKNRRFSRPMARFIAKYPRISPNHVTISSFLVALASGLAFLSSQPIVGGVLAQLASIINGVDGDLAVLTSRVTRFGGFLDAMLDRYGDAAILMGMTCHLSIAWKQNITGLAVGVVALIGSLLVSYSRTRAESDLGIVFDKGVAGYAGNRDVRLFIVMLGGILNQVFFTLLALAILTNLTVLMRIWIVWASCRRGK